MLLEMKVGPAELNIAWATNLSIFVKSIWVETCCRVPKKKKNTPNNSEQEKELQKDQFRRSERL